MSHLPCSMLPARAPAVAVNPAAVATAPAASRPDLCFYEDGLAPHEQACLLQAVLRNLPAGPFRRALALQCSSGALAVHLPAESILMADTSRPLLARAQKQAGQRRQRGRYALWHGSVDRLPVPKAGEQYDLIFADGLRMDVWGPGQSASLRAAVDAQLAAGGILLWLKASAAPLPAFAYTPLHAEPWHVQQHALQLVSYLR